ncbi:MAG TPA: STAS domain-containing protein [Gemmataceae bacterium]|nr:STAS domain-containing protein [Gemmataceae bacterium]
MKITIVSRDPPLGLRMEGQLTVKEIADADRQLEEALVPAGFRQKAVLDLANVGFIDSSGISWLMICHKHFAQAGGKIVFHSAPELIQQTLHLLRLDLVLNLAEDENAARAMALEARK